VPNLLIKLSADFAALRSSLGESASDIASWAASAKKQAATAAAAFDQVTAAAKKVAGGVGGATQSFFDKYSLQAAAATRASAGLNAAGQKAGQGAKSTGSAFAQLSSTINGAINGAKSLFAAIAAFEGIRQIAELSDEFANLSARLKLVTPDQDQFNVVFNKLFDIAQNRGQSFATVAELYTRMSNATKDLGTNQAALLDVTEAVNDAVSLSGVSDQQATNGLIQLSQAFSVGKLQGQDLKAVLEDIPVLGNAIAKGLGLTLAQFRKLATEGDLTSDQVIKALIKAKPALEAQVASLPPTFGKAVTQLKNSALLIVGTIQNAFGGNGIAQIISNFAKSLSSPEFIGDLAEIASKVKTFTGLIVDGFKDLYNLGSKYIGDFVKLAFDDLNKFAGLFLAGGAPFKGLGDFKDFLVETFRDLPENIVAFVQIATVEIASFFDGIVARASAFKDSLGRSFQAVANAADQEFAQTQDGLEAQTALDNEATVSAKTLEQQLKAIAQARADSIDQILKERQASLDAAKAAKDKAAADRASAAKANGTPNAGTAPPVLADAKKIADAQLKLLKDANDRALRQNQDLYDAELIDTETFYAKRRQIQLDSLDAEIAAQLKAFNTAKDANDKLEAQTQIVILARQRTDVYAQEQRDRVKLTKEALDEIIVLAAQSATLDQDTATAANLSLAAQFDEVLKKMRAAGNQAGVALASAVFNKQAIANNAAGITDEASKALDKLQVKLDDITHRQTTGQITVFQASAEEKAARADTLAQLDTLKTKLAALPQTEAAVKDATDKMNGSIDKLSEESATGGSLAIQELSKSLADLNKNIVVNIANAGVDALSQLFNDIASGSKSAGQSLRDFVVSFAQSMLQIATRALATFAVLKALDAIYPGLGQAAALGLGAGGAGKKHGGGMVTAGGRTSSVSSLAFAGAPRFHSGGMVGLGPGEVPIIAQTGEEVLSRNDPRNAKNGGGNGVRIVNAIDPQLFAEFASSAQGEKIILNTITRNKGTIRQTLG
jgi:tape measure domain-containing protein